MSICNTAVSCYHVYTVYSRYVTFLEIATLSECCMSDAVYYARLIHAAGSPSAMECQHFSPSVCLVAVNVTAVPRV